MAIVDILGREVKVGDIVVSTNNSTVYGQIHVVTRLGATDRVQVNGSSYVLAHYMLVCNEQYAITKGTAACEELVAEYKEFFEEKQVQKKLPSPKFWIFRKQNYDKKTSARYFVVKIQGNNQEAYSQVKAFFDKIDLSSMNQYHESKSLNKKNLWCYLDISNAKTLTELKNLGLDHCVNQEIVQGSEEYAVLDGYKSY